MRPEDPQHGTPRGARAHRRDGEEPCVPCLRASRREAKARRVETAQGNPRRVELGQGAWEIVSTVPPTEITRQTGILPSKIVKYRRGGPTTTVHRDTRRRLNGVRGWTMIGLARRLQALQRIGWSMHALGAELSVRPEWLRRLRDGDSTVTKRATAMKIIAGYRRLHMQPQTGKGAVRARNAAMAAGYCSPLDWDTATIDEPAAAPEEASPVPLSAAGSVKDLYDGVVVDRILAGEWRLPANPEERVQVIERWHATGGSDYRLEALTGWNIARIRRDRCAAAAA